jgi:hypothetical protein
MKQIEVKRSIVTAKPALSVAESAFAVAYSMFCQRL